MSTELMSDTRHHAPPRETGTRSRVVTARRGWIYPLLLAVLAGGLWVPRLQGPLDLRYDAGVYYILGTSLAQGHGYRLLNEPGAPAAIQYPPGLPLLAAAYQRALGTSDPVEVGRWLRLTFALLCVAYVLAVYRLGRLFLPAALAFVAALLTLLHVHTTWMSELFFAEIPFALISVVVFILMRGPRTPRSDVAVWALASIGFLLRTAGIALLAAWACESLFRKRYRQLALRTALALVPVLLWQGYIGAVRTAPDYEGAYPYQRASYQFYNVSYLENLSLIDPFVPELGRASAADWALRFGRNLARMPASWGEAITAEAAWTVPRKIDAARDRLGIPVPLGVLLLPFVVIGVLAGGGLLRLARNREMAIPVYVVASTALICLTPWPGQFQRYLAPLTPVLALAALFALQELREWLPTVGARGRIRQLLLPASVTVLLAMQVWPLYMLYSRQRGDAVYQDAQGQVGTYRPFFYSAAWRAQDDLLSWLGNVARPGDVVATSVPHWAFLRTGRQAVMPPFEADPREAQRLLDAVPVRYLVLDDFEFIDVSARYAAPAVRAHPDLWEQVYVTPDSLARVYRRRD